MKRKSLFLPGAALIKWHAVIYIVFTVALWWSVMSTLNYPGNTDVPFSAYQPFILNRIGVTILWGLVFLAHFAFQQMRGWRHDQARQSHLREISEIQNRYTSGARLDLEQNDDEDLLIDEDEWQAQRRLQSK